MPIRVEHQPPLANYMKSIATAKQFQEEDRRNALQGQFAQSIRGLLASMAPAAGSSNIKGGYNVVGGKGGGGAGPSPFTTPPPLNFQGFGGPGLGFGDRTSISQTYTPGAEQFAAGGPQPAPQQSGAGQMIQGFGVPSMDAIGQGLSVAGSLLPGGLGLGAVGGGISALSGFLGGQK